MMDNAVWGNFEDTQLAQCVGAYKNKKKIVKYDGNTVFFMQDARDRPGIGETYYSFDFRECYYDSRERRIHITADICLPKCDDIELKAALADLKTGRIRTLFDGKRVSASGGMSYKVDESCPLEEEDIKQSFVILHGSWHLENDRDIQQASVLDDLRNDIPADYSLYYPKKEEHYVTLSKSGPVRNLMDGDIILPSGMDREDMSGGASETINIALYRLPDDTKDLDYMCDFGKDYNGHPFFCVPLGGQLSIRSSTITIVGAQVFCFLRPQGDRGGYRLAARSDADIISQKITVTYNGSAVSFEKLDPWDDAFLYDGGMEKHIFDICVRIYVSYTYQGGEGNAEFFVTSDSDWPVGKSPETLLPVSIMWGCVGEDSMVLMQDGSRRRISEVRIGDYVKTYDGCARVANVWRGTQEQYVRICAQERELKLTMDHPALTDRGWIRAERLKRGDRLISVSGDKIGIERAENIKEEIGICNLTFEDSAVKTMVVEDIIVGNMEAQNDPAFCEE